MLKTWVFYTLLTAHVRQCSKLNVKNVRDLFDKSSRVEVNGDDDRYDYVAFIENFNNMELKKLSTFESWYPSREYKYFVYKTESFMGVVDSHGYDEFIERIENCTKNNPNRKISETHLREIALYFSTPDHENVFSKLTSYIDRLESILTRMYRFVNTHVMFEFTRSEIAWCDRDTIFEQKLLSRMYKFLEVSHLKVHIMTSFIDVVEQTNFTDRVDSIINIHKKTLLVSVKNNSRSFNTEIRRCDPPAFKRGENFLEFTKLLQSFIPSLEGPRSGIDRVEDCHGGRLQCMTAEMSGKICVSGFPCPKDHCVQINNDTKSGESQHCNNSNLNNRSGLQFCLCSERDMNSDSFVSLKQIKSNTEKNMVVTGLKFMKTNRVIHLQIQQGRLQPDGGINQSSVAWLHPDNVTMITKEMTNNIADLFLLTDMSRTIAVDEIESGDDSYILTGVGFKLIHMKLHLSATFNKFDWDRGELIFGEEKTVNNVELNREYIPIIRPDISTCTSKPSELKSSRTAYVNFTNTDFNKDATQTIVPFFDAQEVTANPAVPLTGTGLYYKGRDGYGGFIAPFVRTHDYLQEIRA